MEDNIKQIVAKNLTNLRRSENLTQTALAKVLDYSDKAISKWECGESLPDLATLCRLAEYYGVTLDYLTHEAPDDSMRVKKTNIADTRRNRIIISCLTITVSLLIMALVFIYSVVEMGDANAWRVFFVAVPVASFVLMCFLRKWKSNAEIRAVATSFFAWGVLAVVYLYAFKLSFWYMMLLGIPIQIIIILSYQLTK